MTPSDTPRPSLTSSRPHRPIARRRLLAAAIGLPVAAMVVAACGSDSDDGSPPTDTIDPVDQPTDPTDPTAPADPTVPDGTDAPPTDGDIVPAADGAILEMGWYGGFTMREIAFQRAPNLLVTADGRVITPAAVAAIFPGPLLPQHTVRTITPEGIERLLAALDDAGLLANVAYDEDSLIADAATATVVVRTADREFRHEAYALDLAPGHTDEPSDQPTEQSAERIALAAAMERLSDLASIVGEDALGPEEPWTPEAYQLIAEPIDDVSGFEPEPTVLDWPAESGVVLAATSSCTEVGRDAVGRVLESANQLTFFTEGDTTYQILARPAYAGRSC
ncbi:MAG: hypothetical protein AAFP84_09370 [Actinomycetota bacterium]